MQLPGVAHKLVVEVRAVSFWSLGWGIAALRFSGSKGADPPPPLSPHVPACRGQAHRTGEELFTTYGARPRKKGAGQDLGFRVGAFEAPVLAASAGVRAGRSSQMFWGALGWCLSLPWARNRQVTLKQPIAGT